METLAAVLVFLFGVNAPTAHVADIEPEVVDNSQKCLQSEVDSGVDAHSNQNVTLPALSGNVEID